MWSQWQDDPVRDHGRITVAGVRSIDPLKLLQIVLDVVEGRDQPQPLPLSDGSHVEDTAA